MNHIINLSFTWLTDIGLYERNTLHVFISKLCFQQRPMSMYQQKDSDFFMIRFSSKFDQDLFLRLFAVCILWLFYILIKETMRMISVKRKLKLFYSSNETWVIVSFSICVYHPMNNSKEWNKGTSSYLMGLQRCISPHWCSWHYTITWELNKRFLSKLFLQFLHYH